MSIPVDIPALADAVAKYGPSAFFLTTGDTGRAHVSHVAVTWIGDDLCVDAGRSGSRNVAARPGTVLLFAPVEVGGYSLIVDVVARIDGDRARLTPERAVLHRPAPAPDAGASGGHDCQPV
jgi:hypothetical protein